MGDDSSESDGDADAVRRLCDKCLFSWLYLGVRKRLGRQEDAFDLGRFDMPVAIGALVWSVFVVFVLVSPPEALTAVLISVGVLAAGRMYLRTC